MICDEGERIEGMNVRIVLPDLLPGHRLKSANNKTSTMFEALRTPRRIILSGTPIQNELSEFHAMASHNELIYGSVLTQLVGRFLQSRPSRYVLLRDGTRIRSWIGQ